MNITRFFGLLLSVFTLLLNCFEIPADYSEVIYPHIIIPGTNVDTSLTPVERYSNMLQSGDTVKGEVNTNFVVYPTENDSIEERCTSEDAPEAYFELLVGDTFFIHVTDNFNGEYLVSTFDTSDISLLISDTLYYDDDSISVVYRFIAKHQSKSTVVYRFHGSSGLSWDYLNFLSVGYCIDAPDTLFISTDSVAWSFLLDIGGSDTLWMPNRLILAGNTNASGITVSQHSAKYDHNGDCDYFDVNRDGTFSINCELNNWREARETIYELIIHGFAGPDRAVVLDSPLKVDE